MVPLLEKHVDYVPHSKSISGCLPHAVLKAHDSKPTREVIAKAITTIQNESYLGPSLQQLETSLQKVEQKIESSFHIVESRIMEQVDRLSTAVNTHTTSEIEAASELQQSNNAFILCHIQMLIEASQEYNKHVTRISTALLQAQSSPSRPTHGLFNTNRHHD